LQRSSFTNKVMSEILIKQEPKGKRGIGVEEEELANC
jgi:hypothetical protein